MSIKDPTELVAEFKKSGEFDRLRRELLAQFRIHDSIGTFASRVHDIIQQRLDEDESLQYLSPEAAHNELMQEMDRFPLVQRTVADLPALSDLAFNASIRRSLARLLNGGAGSGSSSNGAGKQTGQGPTANGDEDGDMDDSSASESESSDEENEHEHEHDQEHEGAPERDHEHEHQNNEQDNKRYTNIPNDMPQNDRARAESRPADRENKDKALVNGVGVGAEAPDGT